MTLSVEMIAESMQPFGARVVMQQERTFAFRRVQMLTPESENTLEEDVLYVSEPKVIRRLPKGLLHDHFFVVRARPEDAEPVRPGANALLYDEQYSLGAVTNHLLTLFDRLQTLEYQMRLAVRAHAGLEPLMEVGRKMIPDATIVVVDSAYNIIGATRERGSGNIYVDQMLEQGYYDKDSLQLMAEAGYFEVSDRYLRPVLSVPPNICNDPVILRSYIANGMFYSFAGCYFPGRLPTMVDQELFRCFTEQLDHYFRETGFYSQSMPQRQQMIHDLLRYGEENPELVRDRARGLRLPETGDFRLGYVEFDEQASTSKAGYMVLQLRAWSNVANYGVMQYQNSVLILFQDWHDYPVGEQLLFRERWDELLTLLGKNHAHIGVSLLFTELGRLRSAKLPAMNELMLRDLLVFHGVHIVEGAALESVDAKGVYYEVEGVPALAEGDTVITAVGMEANHALFDAIRDDYETVLALGDGRRVRNIFGAIWDGYEAARSL